MATGIGSLVNHWPIVWRLTPSGDLAFAPHKVGFYQPGHHNGGIPEYDFDLVTVKDVPVVDINGTVVRSQMCGDVNNPFAGTERRSEVAQGCKWSHNWSVSRKDYDQDTEVCVKFKYYYDINAAITSFNGGVDDNGPISLSKREDDDNGRYNAMVGEFIVPSFETGAFDNESYVIGDTAMRYGHTRVHGPVRLPYALNGQGVYYQLDMRDYKRADAVLYESRSTKFAEDSKIQTPRFCERLNRVYVLLYTVYAITILLLCCKILQMAMEYYQKPEQRPNVLIKAPVIGIFYSLYLLWREKETLTEIENHKQENESNWSVTSRVFGWDKWLNTDLECGAFTYTSTLRDDDRWRKYGTLDRAGNPRTSVKLWETLVYPVVLPYTSTYFRAFFPKKSPWYMRFFISPLFILPLYLICRIINAWVALWPFGLGLAWSIIIWSDHAITMKLIEDLPQTMLGFYYATQIKYNEVAIIGATISLLILVRVLVAVAMSMRKEIHEGIKERRAISEEQKLHRMHGDLNLGRAVWMSTVQPLIQIWVVGFPLHHIWLKNKRMIKSTPNDEEVAYNPKQEVP